MPDDPLAGSEVPALRVRAVNDAPVRAEGDFVLYWMVAARRTDDSYALQRAVEWARELGRPLVVLEALRVAYPHASDRLHRFAVDHMAQNGERCATYGVLHHPYVEPEAGAGSGLLETLGARACLVVTDEFPEFFLPKMVRAGARKLRVRVETVDGCGLIPLRAVPRAFTHAHHFRRWLQREGAAHLGDEPWIDPLARARDLPSLDALPDDVLRRWPAASEEMLRGDADALAALPIDHAVPPVDVRGGAREGKRVLRRFLDDRLPRYAEERNEPQARATSQLSPYLHWGSVSAHRIFRELARREEWSPERLGEPDGRREGWWGMSENAEAFLEELVVWRELSYNTSFRRDGHDRYESLPDWARTTLEEHEDDERPVLLDRAALEEGRTPDPLWNAAQGQLRREGSIHNYMRIVWGKGFLHWTPSPRGALALMLELNDRWAVDGRDPSSVSGIFWCLGRYDRAWGPERPVFGKVRYVSSANTARKVKTGEYVAEFAPGGAPVEG